MIRYELFWQLQLLLLGSCAINIAKEQINAIAKLGMTTSATLRSSDGGGKVLKSLALLTKLERDL